MSGFTDLHALTGAYAVDALDDLERARFERHLEECDDCSAEVDSLRETAGMLHLDDLPPLPAALRARVLGEVSGVRPLPPVVTRHEVARNTARRFPRVISAAAAAVILAAGVGIGNWHPWSDSNDPSEVTMASRVIDASDAQSNSATMPGGGKATVVHSTDLNRVVVMTEDLPQAPLDKTYELWLQDSKGVMKPAGTLAGGADTTVVLDGGVSGSTGVGITVEPEGGSEKPTTTPLALFHLKKA